MAAIVSRSQSVINATKFIEDYTSEDNFLFLGISKSDPWNDNLTAVSDSTIPIVDDSETSENRFREGLIATKRILTSQFSKVVPRIDWQSGLVFHAWDDQEPAFFDSTLSQPRYYALTSSFDIYKCLVAGSGASTVQPSHTTVEPQLYADGYVWHYLARLRPSDAVTFLNSQFMPVLNSSSAEHIAHEEDCQDELSGAIFRVVVTSGGTGYLTAPAVTIEGTGTGALATAIVSGGAVTSIRINVTGSNLVHGSGYKNARVVIAAPPSGGTQATARVVLSPKNGHGTDIESELNACNVEVAVNLEYDEDGKFITENDYRQIGLLRNIVEFGDGPEEFAQGVVYNALNSMTVNTVLGGNFASDEIIKHNASGATAYIDQVSTDNPYTIWFHQNYKTGWTSFQTGQTIVNGNGSGLVSANIVSLVDPEIDKFSGQLVFLENRTQIIRSSTSREEIRIVIQF
jgi:hypothetical protein